ncbi:ABC transporter substrate-binding protein [Streptomyces rimosus]|uniref:ABC transporter substrate-binding protein n=1 Tax=Streptomyces rimosus TaxID=1927 RepID=UPI00311E12F4
MSTQASTPVRPTAPDAVTTALALAITAWGGDGAGRSDQAKSGGAGKVTVTDATATELEVTARPAKLVTLSEIDLDSALALDVKPIGLTAGRGQKGAPEYRAGRPGDRPVASAVTGTDIEKVLRTKPDISLAGQLADHKVLQQLKAIAPTVVTIAQDKDWKKALDLTGRALGKQNEATAFVAGYDAKVAELKKKLGSNAGATVSVARYSAKGTAVMQQGVFISDVLKDLGFKRPGIQNERGQGHSTPISDEDIKQIEGDWPFIGTLAAKGKDADLFAELKNKPAYRQVGAVRDGHVTEIDGSKRNSLGGGLAAMSVLEDIDKAMTT